jgi:DNA-binding FrmR family transcriptional regulator
MKKVDKDSNKNLVLGKLRRVEGQIGGLVKMYEDGRGCLEMAQQIVAARSALSGVAKDILTTEACRCSSSKKDKDEFDRILKTLLDIY